MAHPAGPDILRELLSGGRWRFGDAAQADETGQEFRAGEAELTCQDGIKTAFTTEHDGTKTQLMRRIQDIAERSAGAQPLLTQWHPAELSRGDDETEQHGRIGCMRTRALEIVRAGQWIAPQFLLLEALRQRRPAA